MAELEKGGAKERLFLGAVRVFAAKGYRGATVRDICREAGGANLNAINYYFGGKKKLYQTILEVLFTEGNRQLRERLDEIGEVPPEERLRLLLEVCCRLFFTGSEVCRAFMRIPSNGFWSPSCGKISSIRCWRGCGCCFWPCWRFPCPWPE